MADTVPEGDQLHQVARIARVRTATATPPSPRQGSPPFDHALPNWLGLVTPLGADVLHTNQSVLPLTAASWTAVEPPHLMTTRERPDGGRVTESHATADAYRPERLPSEAPREQQRRREARIREAWTRAHALCLALHEAGVGARGTARGSLALAETALWIAGSDTRQPGVPIHGLTTRSIGSRLHREGNELVGPRWGKNGRAVITLECAASHDLAGATAVQLSRAQGWADHVDADGRPGPASSAKRAIREGRALLSRLGAWPWAHADRGRLHDHPSWWSDAVFLGPLRTWLARSWGRLVFDEHARLRDASALEPRAGIRGAASAWVLPELERLAVDTIFALEAEDFLA
jgi:hypothetical protein